MWILETEILSPNVNILHHFHDEFAPLAILPVLNKEIQVNLPVEEAIEVILEEKGEAMDETGS